MAIQAEDREYVMAFRGDPEAVAAALADVCEVTMRPARLPDDLIALVPGLSRALRGVDWASGSATSPWPVVPGLAERAG